VIRDGLLLLIAKLYWAKVLVFFRGWDVRCERAIRRRFSRLFRCIYSRADAFIVLASRFRLVLEDLGCAGRVYVETTIVPDDVFARGVRKRRERVSAGGALNILFLSRVEKLKGVYIAIEAFRILKHKHPSATLTIAGDGSDLEEVREFVASQQIPGVKFPGWLGREAKREAFSNAHLYLFPTLWGEGMPNSVLEAMAYGLPVVTRPVGGLRDFFQDGRMGFVIESDDPKDFGEALDALAEDATLRDRIGIYNREYALHNFKASHVARRLERIYASMVAL
jgi:glycosyltransferase involved in cell wall biosynthesis